jgi:PTH1 family peptidyl-tRNA hydrolase
VGFAVLDRLARSKNLLFRAANQLPGYAGPARFRWARSIELDALLVKPLTWMNESGAAVAPLARWAGWGAGMQPSELLVVYDDLDLALGELRIRPHGGAGGHNGMRSIIASLGTERFPRLRVGIGRSSTDAARHVLSEFDERERVEIDISVAEAAEAILDWLASGDLERTMTRYHSRWNQGSG